MLANLPRLLGVFCRFMCARMPHLACRIGLDVETTVHWEAKWKIISSQKCPRDHLIVCKSEPPYGISDILSFSGFPET